MTTQLQHDGTGDLALCLRTLPRRIKIGAYDWKIVLEAEESSDFGETDYDTFTIRLWAKNLTSPDVVVGTALHECLHVVFENHGLEKMRRTKDEREEQIVRGFEAGLISLFRDNPKFLVWFKKWLGRK